MVVFDVAQAAGKWLYEGPSDLATEVRCGWPCRVADMVLANIDRKIKKGTTASQPSPVGLVSSADPM